MQTAVLLDWVSWRYPSSTPLATGSLTLIYNQNSYCRCISILRSTFLVISETTSRRHRRLSTCNVHTRDKTELASWQPNSLWVSRYKYCRVWFCDGSFYDDSLLRHLSSRTEHSRLAVHHCRNSSVLSLLSALLALFRCACDSFSI